MRRMMRVMNVMIFNFLEMNLCQITKLKRIIMFGTHQLVYKDLCKISTMSSLLQKARSVGKTVRLFGNDI